MSSYQSMRESSIAGRLRALSSDAGPKTEDKSDKVAVVNATGPSEAQKCLRSEGTTSAPRSDRSPRKCGGRTMKKADGGPAGAPKQGIPRTHTYSDGSTIELGPRNGDSWLKQLKDGTANKAIEAAKGKGKAAGGKVKHDDAAEDKAMIKRMVKSDALSGKKSGGRSAYADGGKVGSKGSTTINIVMPQKDENKDPMPVPVPVGGPAPAPRPQPPQMPPQGLAPTLALKTGGRANFTAGAGSGEGRLEKTAHEKGRK